MPVQVSNLAQQNLTLSNILRTQERIFEREIQISSGKESRDYAGIARSASRLVNLENAGEQADRFIKNNEALKLRVQLMETNVASMFDLASDFRAQLVAALNSAETAATSPTSVKGVRTFASPATDTLTAGAGGYGTLTIKVTDTGGATDGTLGLDLDTLQSELQNDGVLAAGAALTVENVVKALNGDYGTGGANQLTNPVDGLPQATATAQGGLVSGDFAEIDANGFFRLAVQGPSGTTGAFRMAIDDTQTTVSRFGVETGLKEVLGFTTDTTRARTATDMNLREVATDTLRSLANIINSDLDGRFLFAGSKVQTLPWDVEAFLDDTSVAFPPVKADADYSTAWYQGDSVTLKARVDESLTVPYGVTGNNAVFEKLVRALRVARDAVDSNGDFSAERLRGAANLLNSVIQDLPDLRTEIGNDLKTIENVNIRHRDFKLFAEEAISDIENVDVVATTNLLNADQVQIQASYLAVSRIRNLTIANFLN